MRAGWARRLSDINQKDVGDAISDYAKRLRNAGGTGSNANKVLAATKRLFKRAKGWGIVDMPNPAYDLERQVAEEPRERGLYDGQVLAPPLEAAFQPALSVVFFVSQALRPATFTKVRLPKASAWSRAEGAAG